MLDSLLSTRDPAAWTTDIHRRLAPSRARLAAADAALVATQVAVSQIAAPTGDEGDRAAWLIERFRDAGLPSVDVDTAGNVVATIAAGDAKGPRVAVCSHIDTVFPRGTDLSVRQSGSRMLGPGITDNARGVAVMLAIAAEVAAGRVVTEHPIEFVATTGEEGAGDLRGAKHYFAGRGAGARAAVIIDGAGDERIVHRALGSRRFHVRFDGPGGHSWAAFGAPNAVHAAAAATAAIAAIPLPVEPRSAVTVARIGGGLSVNSIPGHAWFEVDVRSSSDAVVATLSAQIGQAVHAAVVDANRRRTPGTSELHVRIDAIGDRPGGETPPAHSLVQAAVEATRLIGRRAELAMASTDANVPISIGIPAVAIGAGGRSGDTHSTAEWYDNADGPLGVARALTIVAAAAGLRD